MAIDTDLFEKARTHERLEQLKAAREHDLLPYFREVEGEPGPVVLMEGRERITLGSNNYLGLTGDPRVKQAARDALDAYGTGPDRLALHERHHAAAPRARARARRLDGHRGRARLHHRLPGQRGLHRARCSGPGDTVICDSGDHASILDAVMMSRARIRPFRHNRLDKLETMLDARRADGGGVLVVVDGVFSMEGDLAPLPDIVALCREHGARLMVDEAHGVGVLGEPRHRAPARLLGVRGRGGPAHGHVLEVARLVRRLHRRPARGDRLPARPVARVHVHRLGRAGGRGRRARRAADHPLRRGPRAAGPACSTTPATCTRAWPSSASTWWQPTALPDGSELITPIVPVLVGDDWQAVLFWKALYDEGVYANVALYPAVPRGGALLRTRVMATHERDHLDRALATFERVKGEVEAMTPPDMPTPAAPEAGADEAG